ncbi:uncharacterized protein LAESUDRAFT_238186 [Laetiporus sulphureus 93-53]|uniref:Uncharacterized protein n=1 Tax=Laetiporus sulphureus 93-53 TaxID=1314785 RepID=A0A165DNT1_9APHY|nr:uncharacterized protein LAESUDRAFT_238186 [Laetiporus sulphureus 93-53]KZT05291.1 hypothetical protein LAESUDRAFT_238186 [Laetiporus sulphureus 93-53]
MSMVCERETGHVQLRARARGRCVISGSVYQNVCRGAQIQLACAGAAIQRSSSSYQFARTRHYRTALNPLGRPCDKQYDAMQYVQVQVRTGTALTSQAQAQAQAQAHAHLHLRSPLLVIARDRRVIRSQDTLASRLVRVGRRDIRPRWFNLPPRPNTRASLDSTPAHYTRKMSPGARQACAAQ